MADKKPPKAPRKPPKRPKKGKAPPPPPAPGWRGRLRRVVRALRNLVLWLAALGVVLPILQAALLNIINPPLTLTMVDRFLEHYQETRELDWPERDWVDLDELPAHVPKAAIAAEDARFLEHSGFDWEAIEGAWKRNAKSKRLRGGSTISQQTAKNVFLWQERSWLRKGLEVWYTFWMELLVPKERILEVYLNVAETGPMTFGVEAGSRLWYKRPAAEMSSDQSARLMSILPAPNSWSPHSSYVRGRAAKISPGAVALPKGFGSN